MGDCTPKVMVVTTPLGGIPFASCPGGRVQNGDINTIKLGVSGSTVNSIEPIPCYIKRSCTVMYLQDQELEDYYELGGTDPAPGIGPFSCNIELEEGDSYVSFVAGSCPEQ